MRARPLGSSLPEVTLKFVDECVIQAVAGNGGNGAVAFRREKHVPFGGPSGGNGGAGGSVVLVGDEGLSTLLDLAYAHKLEAQRGQHGMGSDCFGKAGKDLLVRVPVGTRVIDLESGETFGEVLEHGQKLVVAKGGNGGRGNMNFATPFDRAPRRAEPGTPGEARKLRLELSVLADVGLLGFPNVGKSTLIRAVSKARPKVADYPFTTLQPHLGIVSVGGMHDGTSFAMADIPGLIPGASEGAGLGIRFLKHLERTRVLVHLVTIDPEPSRDPVSDYEALRSELAAFNAELENRPEIVAVSKCDLPDVQEALSELREKFRRKGIQLRVISAATGEGCKQLIEELAAMVQRARAGIVLDDEPDEREVEEKLEAPKKAAPKKAAPKKAAPKKAAPKKAAPKKAAPKKAAPKKAAPKKAAPKKAAPKKAAPKKAAPKKAAPKKAAPKKAAPKKAAPKKAAPKKAAPKKAAPKKAAPKKAAPKKAAPKSKKKR